MGTETDPEAIRESVMSQLLIRAHARTSRTVHISRYRAKDRSWILKVYGLLLSLVLLMLLAFPLQGEAAPAPQSVSLKRSDVPPAYQPVDITREQQRFIDLRYVAPTAKPMGLVASNFVMFGRVTTAPAREPDIISSEVELFSNPAAAHAAYQHAAMPVAGVRIAAVVGARPGAEATLQYIKLGHLLTLSSLTFRRGPYLVAIELEGGAIYGSEADRYARIVDARIKRAP